MCEASLQPSGPHDPNASLKPSRERSVLWGRVNVSGLDGLGALIN